jgi:hypothetical protein
MTAVTRPPITSFPRGHTFARASFSLDAAAVRAYLDAVGDANDYGASIPPLAVIAFALRELQASVSLPDGALHTGQEVEHEAVVRVGAPLTMQAVVAQRSERQGFVITVVEIVVEQDRVPALRARTTIMAPAGGGA